METKSKNFSLKALLIVIAIGIWAIVLQNAGVIPTSQKVQGVNSVGIDGYVNVRGSVSIDNMVDINIRSINGFKNAFYQDRDGDYMVLPVTQR